MLRCACVLLLLAGCDQVFDLTEPPPPPGHDEDGDKIPDTDDLCPHIAQTTEDRDRDGIGDLCDPFPDDDANTAIFVGFENGVMFDGGELLYGGTFSPDGDDILFGDPTDQPATLYLPDVASTARVVVDAQLVVEGTIEDPAPDGTFHEFGAVFMNQTNAHESRGNICFTGYDVDDPAYLELVENIDHKPSGSARSDQLLRALRAKLVATRSNALMTCTVTAPGINLAGEFVPTLVTGGRIGVWTQKARVRLHYLWVVTRP